MNGWNAKKIEFSLLFRKCTLKGLKSPTESNFVIDTVETERAPCQITPGVLRYAQDDSIKKGARPESPVPPKNADRQECLSYLSI